MDIKISSGQLFKGAVAVSGAYMLSKFMYEKGFKHGMEHAQESSSIRGPGSTVVTMGEDKLDYYADQIREELESENTHPEKHEKEMRSLEKRLDRASNAVPLMEGNSVPIELSKEDRIILAAVDQ